MHSTNGFPCVPVEPTLRSRQEARRECRERLEKSDKFAAIPSPKGRPHHPCVPHTELSEAANISEIKFSLLRKQTKEGKKSLCYLKKLKNYGAKGLPDLFIASKGDY